MHREGHQRNLLDRRSILADPFSPLHLSHGENQKSQASGYTHKPYSQVVFVMTREFACAEEVRRSAPGLNTRCQAFDLIDTLLNLLRIRNKTQELYWGTAERCKVLRNLE